jgi:hypothetical protein
MLDLFKMLVLTMYGRASPLQPPLPISNSFLPTNTFGALACLDILSSWIFPDERSPCLPLRDRVETDVSP